LTAKTCPVGTGAADTGAPISAIGVGPGRDETVQVRSLLG
jgi:hypothetical protein